MTLELTPDQLQILRAAVAYKHTDLTDAVRRLAFAHHSTFAEGKAKLTELEALRDLLAKTSTVILHQP